MLLKFCYAFNEALVVNDFLIMKKISGSFCFGKFYGCVQDSAISYKDR